MPDTELQRNVCENPMMASSRTLEKVGGILRTVQHSQILLGVAVSAEIHLKASINVEQKEFADSYAHPVAGKVSCVDAMVSPCISVEKVWLLDHSAVVSFHGGNEDVVIEAVNEQLHVGGNCRFCSHLNGYVFIPHPQTFYIIARGRMHCSQQPYFEYWPVRALPPIRSSLRARNSP